LNRIETMDIRYEDLVAAVERAINEADPGLLAGGAPSDEYAPEIGTIIPCSRTRTGLTM
jgi:hypothetical protein